MSNDSIFPKGSKAETNFTGTAYVNFLIKDENNIFNCQVYDVVFEAGCRNDWHKHEGGQLLLCTDGVGYYQKRGKPSHKLIKGDVVEIPPYVEHWHGAAPNSSFTHIGISPNTDKGGATWIAPVTDEEYTAATQ